MVEMVKDPVCGMKTEGGKICSEYEGKRYCFCSEGCKQKFDAEPTKYAGKEERGGCCS